MKVEITHKGRVLLSFWATQEPQEPQEPQCATPSRQEVRPAYVGQSPAIPTDELIGRVKREAMSFAGGSTDEKIKLLIDIVERLYNEMTPAPFIQPPFIPSVPGVVSSLWTGHQAGTPLVNQTDGSNGSTSDWRQLNTQPMRGKTRGKDRI